MKYTLTLLILILSLTGFSQSAHKLLRSGNSSYEMENYDNAEIQYRRSLEIKSSRKGNYNLGNALYKKGEFKQAVQYYQNAIAASDSKEDLANTYHNLGNTLLKNQLYEESIEAFKNALRNNPKDMETKYNLSLAMKKLEEQKKQEEQKEQDKNDKDGEGDSEQENDSESESEKKKEDEEKKEEKNKQNQEPNNQSKEQEQQQGKPQELTKQEAQELLQIMDDEEQKVQKKLRRASAQPSKSAKDW